MKYKVTHFTAKTKFLGDFRKDIPPSLEEHLNLPEHEGWEVVTIVPIMGMMIVWKKAN